MNKDVRKITKAFQEYKEIATLTEEIKVKNAKLKFMLDNPMSEWDKYNLTAEEELILESMWESEVN